MSVVEKKDPQSRSNKLRNVTRQVVWARAAGRCQICNRELIGDLISGREDANFGFIAHIIAAAPGGPRGDPILSWELADNPSNLMLLCDIHHKMIDDRDGEKEYPRECLLDIKEAHEARITTQTGIRPERSSHVLRYGANVGAHRAQMPYQNLANAMLPKRYPAQGTTTIDLSMKGVAREDDESEFWGIEAENLKRLFRTRVHERIDAGDVHHLSVFALAPQPLLILLGSLIGDITPVDVFQLHREPATWEWIDSGSEMVLQTSMPESKEGPVALKISLSATIEDSRVRSVLGANASIWTVTVPGPNNDILNRKEDLRVFRQKLRILFDDIKAAHGEETVINLFPAMPVATAVELGRVWMPKADLPMMIWDQNQRLGGFCKALEIGTH